MVTVYGKAHANVAGYLRELWMVASDFEAHGQPLIVRELEGEPRLTPREIRQLQ